MKLYKILFFITAASQIVSTFFTSFTGGSNFNELLITPAGYTFAIWGVITTFSTVYAGYHLFSNKKFSRRIYLLLSSVYICFTLWLLAAERSMIFLTVLIFLYMFSVLLYVLNALTKQGFHTIWDKIFLQGGVGMYLGWSSIAFVVNIAVYVFTFGISSTSDTGIYLQIIVLGATTLSAAYALRVSRYNKVVFGTHWWAFVGIVIGLLTRDNTTLLLVSVAIFIGALNIFYFKLKSY